MPNPYQNLPKKPVSGGMVWSPPYPPTGGEVPGLAFNFLTITRGKFRNDLPAVAGQTFTPTVTTAYTGKLASPVPSIDWPILATFRPLSSPSISIGVPPSAPCIVSGADLSWTVSIVQPVPISSVQINYALTIDLNDPMLPPLLTTADQQSLKQYISALQGGNKPEPPSIDWAQYPFGRISVVSGQATTEYPTPVKDIPSQLLVTDYEHLSPSQISVNVKFGSGSLPSGYPRASAIRIDNRYQIPSLKLYIYRMMIFNAEAVNLTSKQTPCTALAYAYEVNFTYDPSRQTLIWPTDSETAPSFHMKVFSPDQNTLSSGFAHSLVLRFLIFSLPIFGIAPADLTSLQGALDSINNPLNPYLTVFVGPVAGTRSIFMSLLPTPIVNPSGRVVEIDTVSAAAGTVNITLQKAVGSNGASIPADNAEWTSLSDYSPSTPPEFSASGPWVRPFRYLDIGAKIDDWYRSIQTLDSGAQITTQAFRNSLNAARAVLAMQDSSQAVSASNIEIVRQRAILPTEFTQNDPLKADPIALFIDETSDPLSSPIMFSRGQWIFQIRGSSQDSLSLVDTHVFARFWFFPENEQLDPSNPHKYRDGQQSTEFYFQSNANGTTLMNGNPTSMDQVMVSPPLPLELTLMQLIRYADSFKGGSFSGSSYTLPFGSGVRGKLVIGLYAVSYPTPDGKAVSSEDLAEPQFTVELNSQYAAFLTTISQTLSGEILPERASAYASSVYLPLGLPLAVTRYIIGSTPDKDSGYAIYNKSYKPAISGTPILNALGGLFALEASAAEKFCVPFTQVSLKRDQSTPVHVDFATNATTLAQGRILSGNWGFEVDVNRSFDTAQVGCDFRIEAFLATTNGLITERILRTGILKGPNTGTSEGTYKITTPKNLSVAVPFEVGGADTQLIVRLWVYPFSFSGNVVDIAKITKQLASQAAPLPFGLRVDGFTVTAHTANYLRINQVASRFGSPAYYEDLSLVPSNALDSQQFWYVASSTNLAIAITFVDDGSSSGGWPISGTLYSPSWIVNLPQGLEVKYQAIGLGNGGPVFRTVPGSSSSSTSEGSISAVEDKRSGVVHMVSDEAPVDGASNSLTGRVVRHLSFNRPNDPPIMSALVQGQSAGASVSLEGKFPSLHYIRSGASKKQGAILGLMAQVDEASYSSYTVALSPSNGAKGAWIGPNRDLGDKSFGALRRVAEGLSYPALAQSSNQNLILAAGWVPSGTVVLREVNLFDAGRDGSLAEGNVYVVDGDINPTLQSGQTAILPVTPLNGTAVETFPAVLVDSAGRITVAYALQGQDGILYARTSVAGQAFGPAYPVVNMRAQGANGSSDLAISGVILHWHESTSTGYLAFYCGGRIFVSSVSSFGPKLAGGLINGGVVLGTLQIVAGSRDISSANNSTNSAMSALLNSGALRVDQAGVAEEDVPKQRPGFFVSDRWPSQGNLFVYYQSAKGEIYVREVRIGGVTGPPLLIPTTDTS